MVATAPSWAVASSRGGAFQRSVAALCINASNPLYIRLATMASESLPNMAETKTAQVNLRIAPSLKAAAEKAAAADHRSLTSLVEKLLADYCREHGFLTDKGRGRK